MATAASDIPVGAVVDIPLGRGVVRFSGTTSFQVGKWIGVELSEPKGKNDGTVQGVQYFACKMNYGVFIKPSQVKLVRVPDPSPRPAAAARPSLGHARTPSAGVSRTPSLRSMPPASPRSSSPAKTAASPGPSATTFRSSRLAPPSPTKRPAAQPRTPASRTTDPRRSSIHGAGGLAASTSGPTPRALPFKQRPMSPPQPTQPRTASGASQASSLLSPLGSDLHASHSPLQHTDSDLSAELDAPPPAPPPPPVQVVNANEEELQELRAKVRVLEAHRSDDARHIRELETRLTEAESFVALRPKLQAKLTTQQTELIAARRELADAQQLAELAEGRILDAHEQLEMAALDKEVAEERAEAVEAELEEVKERLAVVEVELNVLKEGERDGEDGVDPAVAGSLAYIQLEKQNARLKEALVRLRDITSETELEQRRRIQDMEKDVMHLDDMQNELESTYIKLTNADQQIEDLKVQLDDALGAEEMLVQLTERNLMLGEKIEEMRITIEDLEALRELNDELEENHVETEKAMQDEINDKDVQINGQQRRIDALEEACQDLEGTISQFRELVLHLQTELDSLRAQTQTAQSESAAAASQTAQMMSLNLKLQSTASKHQARTIDMEIHRIDAREAREMLAVVQPYLPRVYADGEDVDATRTYFFFRRVAAKAELISAVCAQAHGLPDALNGAVPDVLVGVTEMRGAIAALAVVCRRFAAILRRCDVESFLSIGRLYPEIAPMEKRIDMHIDLLRREEFREMECVSDISKMQAQFDHLAETYFQGFECDLGERELGFVVAFDHDLDIYASAVGLTKTSVAEALKDDDLVSETNGIDPETEIFQPMQRILDQCKGAKVVSKKLTRRMEDLLVDSCALKPHLAVELKQLANRVSELINFGIAVAQQTMPHIAEARANRTPFQLGRVFGLVRETALATVGKSRKDAGGPWEMLGAAMSQLLAEANALLPVTMDTENVVKVQGVPPWTLRVEEIRASLAVNVEAERKVAQLNEELQGLVRTLKARDQHIQESAVKIELMERRMEGVRRQADALAELEAELAKARKQERSYEDALEQLQAELDAMEQENAKMKAAGAGAEPAQAGTAQAQDAESVAVEGSLETSHLLEQIDGLRGAVRFLRSENAFLKGHDLVRELAALPPLPALAPRAPTPPLAPSTLSDSDSESDAEAGGARTPPPPSLRALATERKALYRRVMAFSSAPKVVDLSGDRRGWQPRARRPAAQVLERRMEAERLERRVKGLMERTSALAVVRRL
ncbi:dynactin [Vararia minispora EC-137]|uniref:Dynactin n=1 Tax=Vararia minispora EC-137 TaxID=1314806 RepID=A0ACB8QGN3_9AGAM|nr:dynactin [Vararia minispora EC-137]